MDNKSVVGLSEAIEALRAELVQAAVVGEDEQMRFAVEPIELTVQVAVTKDANGKVGWNILEARAGIQHMVTQTLTLRLAPLWKTEEGAVTRDFSIASATFDKNQKIKIGRRDN